MSYERDPIVDRLPYFRLRMHDVLVRQVLKNEGDFLLRWKNQQGAKGQYFLTVLFCDGLDDYFIVKDDPLFMFRHRKRSALSVVELIELYVRDQLPVSLAYGPALVQSKERQVWEVEFGSKVDLPNGRRAIGVGRHGDVFEGNYKKAETGVELVAVKTFYKVLGTADEKNAIKERIEKLDILRQIGSHPNIMAPFGFGIAIDQDQPMVIYELMKSPTTFQWWLRTGIQSILPKLKWMTDALEGIAHIHSKGWLVRDICTQNCLIGKEKNDIAGRLKLIKLGSVKFLGTEKSWTETPKQQLRWMAPETLETNVWTMETDVWTAGVFMWEVLSNAPLPYKDLVQLTKQQLIDHLKSGKRLQVPSTTPEPLAEVVKSCWHEDPSKRPKVAAILEVVKNVTKESQMKVELEKK